MESASGSKKKRLSPSSVSQIQILHALASSTESPEPRRLEITEIAQRSGLVDEKETQRFLFILEGQKLVTPFPEGDFTSKIWQITSQGVQTLRQISSAMTN
jgi:DNA-binding IclR family transcriptional regulator